MIPRLTPQRRDRGVQAIEVGVVVEDEQGAPLESVLVIERHRDGSAFEKTAAYCRAVRSGPAVAVSGTAATAADGSALHPGDTYRQTREAFDRAVAAAHALGADIGDTVRTRLYLSPESDWQEAVRAHREVFQGIDPANTTIYVAGFIPPGVLVEVELDAWVVE